ncbi:bifunctional 3-(3-hydroxy-phenyl)propionate/3-hydroxycinnamic acid hydroxylase [Brevibacterium sp. 'Marine']|uniref:bifunctional 3-(3-hydroxy-phenyl)propionate/3-hydroxycinnamic acid hydroxylase MhpA n=1 Tax=Brevibacterium sp. 'Marine' TaxID=2725563 RepID=UPI00145EE332|nr:bifunctional 3-(3-hydroxy-phenyl)propionate/3-hydroxycinnamic acid hydroxylase [Brevibacterium sp. 'Marine']
MPSSDRAIETQVAIIGYGPVGVSAANMLGRLGVDTVVIEKDEDLYNRARAIATDEEVIRIWQSVGLADELKDDMLFDCPIDFVGRDGRSFLSYTPKPRGHGHPTQLFIYQPALEQTLRDGVSRYPNVRVLLGHEATRLSQDDDGATIEFRSSEDGSTGTVRAKYVIAADGGSSPTRGRLGVGFEGRTYEDRWVVIDTKVLREWPEVNRLRFHCNPERPAVDCPTPLDHHRWEFPVLPSDDEERLVTHEAIDELLNQQGIEPANVEVLRAVIYSHHVRFAEDWRCGRVFLAGDAAHVMPPWVGEGMASGVRDAANLTWKLAAVLQGSLPDAALDSYEEERKPHVRKLTFSAVACGRIITERRRLIAALRNPAMRAFAKFPKIGRVISDGDWFPDARYTRGMLGGAPYLRRDPIGWLIPQPHVLDAHGDTKLLDDALPKGWAVVTSGTANDPDGIDAWRRCGVPVVELLAPGSTPRPGALIDYDGSLGRWLRDHSATAVALRPDRYVYASAGRSRGLAAPPLTQQYSTHLRTATVG